MNSAFSLLIHVFFTQICRMQSDALDLSPEERKLDKRFPEYWADLARTNLLSKMPWIDEIYQPPTHPIRRRGGRGGRGTGDEEDSEDSYDKDFIASRDKEDK